MRASRADATVWWLTGVACFGLALSAILITRAANGVAAIWLANAFVTGMAVRNAGRRLIGVFCAGSAGMLLANALTSESWPSVAGFALVNLAEILMAWAGLRLADVRHGLFPNERDFFVGGTVAVVVAPAIAAALGATWWSATGGHAWWPTMRTWWISDVLGMLALLPVVWTADRAGVRGLVSGARVTEFWLSLVVTIAVCVVASLWLKRPFVVITLPLLVIAYRLGLFRLSVIGLASVLTVIATAILANKDLIAGDVHELSELGVGQLGFYCGLSLLGPLLVSVVVEQREALAEQMRHMSHHDALTTLPNRTMLLAHPPRTASAGSDGLSGAVLFMDLDHFKAVNDSLGHSFGDRVLQETAKRMASCVRSGDAIFRHGGDEFILLLRELARPDDAGDIANALIRAIEAPMLIEGRSVTISASVGIAPFARHAHDIGTLIRQADSALYRAKASGRGCFRYFDAEADDLAPARSP
jgi:diguanylate cyclase (GGDEF)-like protein